VVYSWCSFWNCSCSQLQLAAIAQPLPDRGGFYDGGYTGSGPERNSPGPVHYDEYVVPKKYCLAMIQ
jgi:hypothetical protein